MWLYSNTILCIYLYTYYVWDNSTIYVLTMIAYLKIFNFLKLYSRTSVIRASINRIISQFFLKISINHKQLIRKRILVQQEFLSYTSMFNRITIFLTLYNCLKGYKLPSYGNLFHISPNRKLFLFLLGKRLHFMHIWMKWRTSICFCCMNEYWE